MIKLLKESQFCYFYYYDRLFFNLSKKKKLLHSGDYLPVSDRWPNGRTDGRTMLVIG